MNINHLIKDLKKGNNPEENLSVYGQVLMASYQRLALGDFALAFTENYDFLEKAQDGVIADGRDTVVSVAQSICSGNCDYSEAIAKLDTCRGRTIEAMHQLERYLHFFEIYEHILNRLEYQYDSEPVLKDMETFTSQIMEYITAAKDAEEVNERIQTILGELPIRLTTGKYLELLEKACRCYIGGRSDMVDSFFGFMERCFVIPKVSELSGDWEDMYAIAGDLASADLKNLSKEEWKALSDKLALISRTMAGELGNITDLMNLIDKLYILLITTPYVTAPVGENQQIFNIIRAYLKAVESGDFLDIDEDILGGMEKVLEKQQKYIGEHMFMEDVLDEVYVKYEKEIDGMMLGGSYKALKTAERLNKAYPVDDIMDFTPLYAADADDIKERIKHLTEICKESFSREPQIIRRGLMSIGFESMPVPFDSLADLESFILAALNGCTSEYEKAASVHIIESMMAQNF